MAAVRDTEVSSALSAAYLVVVRTAFQTETNSLFANDDLVAELTVESVAKDETLSGVRIDGRPVEDVMADRIRTIPRAEQHLIAAALRPRLGLSLGQCWLNAVTSEQAVS